MSKQLPKAVWAGLAVRLEDGSLIAVEVDERILTDIQVSVEQVPDNDDRVFQTYHDGPTVISAKITGIGRKIASLNPDMGQQAAQREAENASGSRHE